VIGGVVSLLSSWFTGGVPLHPPRFLNTILWTDQVAGRLGVSLVCVILFFPSGSARLFDLSGENRS